MQFLAYESDEGGSDSDGVKSTSEIVRDNAALTNDLVNLYASKWTEKSDSSSDEDSSENEIDCAEFGQQESGLVDANVLLSSVTDTPKFLLSKNVVDKFEVSEIKKTKQYSDVDKSQKTYAVASRPSNDDVAKQVNRAVPVALQQAANLSSSSSKAQFSGAESNSNDSSLKKKLNERDGSKKEKETAKVRVS